MGRTTDMAFGSRHCWGIALLLIVVTQVMLSSCYQDEHTYSSSRSRNDGYERHNPMDRRDRNEHGGSHGGGHSDHDSSREHHDNDGHGHDEDHNAATSATAMFQTTMLVGTFLMLYRI